MPANYHSEKKKKEVNSNAGAGSGEVSRYSFFEGVQVVGRWKKIRRKRVPEPTSGREERVIILVDSCERYFDRKGVRRYRKSCVARSPKKGRHTTTKVRKTVAMKIAIEERQGCNTAASRKKLRVISERGRVDKAEGFRLHLIQKCCVGRVTPNRRCVLHTGAD